MAPTEPIEFRTLLKQYRAQAGFSQEALAERAGLSTRVVSDIERGVIKAPHRDTVRRVSDALGLATEQRAASGGLCHRAAAGATSPTRRSPMGCTPRPPRDPILS